MKYRKRTGINYHSIEQAITIDESVTPALTLL